MSISQPGMSAEKNNKEYLELASKHGVSEEVEVFFSPHGNCQLEIQEELEQATKTIDLTMYTFTSKDLAETLVKAKMKGCKIRVFLDDGMKTAKYSQANKLEDAGILVKFDNHAGLMHNKFVVIDGKTAITGSYNWTSRAENQNDENIVIMHNTEIAQVFAERFEELWGA